MNWEDNDLGFAMPMNFKSFSPPPPINDQKFVEEDNLQLSDGCERKSEQIPGRKSILKSEGSRSTHSNVAFAQEFSRLDFTGGHGRKVVSNIDFSFFFFI